MNEMRVTVPAGREWGLVINLALGAAGSLAGLSLAVIDDLRSAAEEAFELLTHQERRVEQVTLITSVEHGMFNLALNAHRAEHLTACKPMDPEMAQLIIGTLVTDVKLEGDHCGIYSVTMALPAGTK
ncbi:MAG: hypothetical protein ACOX6Y_11800 [Christensenellales bacterium]|jgi:DNA-binding NtrC family response regulator